MHGCCVGGGVRPPLRKPFLKLKLQKSFNVVVLDCWTHNLLDVAIIFPFCRTSSSSALLSSVNQEYDGGWGERKYNKKLEAILILATKCRQRLL